jgi:hypothetical protein
MMRIELCTVTPELFHEIRGRREQRVPKTSNIATIAPKVGRAPQFPTLLSERMLATTADSVTAMRPTPMSRTNQEAYDPTVA